MKAFRIFLIAFLGCFTAVAQQPKLREVETFQILSTHPRDLDTVRFLKGYRSMNDGGQGLWEMTNVVSGTNIGTRVHSGSVGFSWERPHSGDINVRWFGSYGDGTHDDAPFIQAAHDYATASGFTIFVPCGTYLLGSSLNISNNALIHGEGPCSIFTSSGNVFNFGSATNVVLRNFAVAGAVTERVYDQSNPQLVNYPLEVALTTNTTALAKLFRVYVKGNGDGLTVRQAANKTNYLIGLGGIEYRPPYVQGGAGSVPVNDGSGGLTWMPNLTVSVTNGSFAADIATNAVAFWDNTGTLTGNSKIGYDGSTVTFTNLSLISIAAITRFEAGGSLSFLDSSSLSMASNSSVAFIDSSIVTGTKLGGGGGTTNWNFNYAADSNTVARLKDITNVVANAGGGTNMTGSGVANQITYWTGSSGLGGSPKLTFDGNNLLLTNFTLFDIGATVAMRFESGGSLSFLDSASISMASNSSLAFIDKSIVTGTSIPLGATTNWNFNYSSDSNTVARLKDVTNIVNASSSGITNAYTLIQDEGVPLTKRTTMNFTGFGVTASDSGGVTLVDIPGLSQTFPIAVTNGGTGTNFFSSFAEGIIPFYSPSRRTFDGDTNAFQYNKSFKLMTVFRPAGGPGAGQPLIQLIESSPLASAGLRANGAYWANTNVFLDYDTDLAIRNVSGSPVRVIKATAASSIVIGDGTTTTTRSNKFLYLPTTAGPPTGVPVVEAGTRATTYDSVNDKIYVYDGTNWVAYPSTLSVTNIVSTVSTTINPTDGFIPYRLNSTTFSNSPMSRIAAGRVEIDGSMSFNGTSASFPMLTNSGTLLILQAADNSTSADLSVGSEVINNFLSLRKVTSTFSGSGGQIPSSQTLRYISGTTTNETLTGTPTVAAGSGLNGEQLLILVGKGTTNTVTLQDNGTLAGSALILGANTRTLQYGQSLVLRYSTADSKWYEVSYSGAGDGGYNIIQDEGAPLMARTTINFVGAGVTSADVGGVTRVTIPSSATPGTGLENEVTFWNNAGGIQGDTNFVYDPSLPQLTIKALANDGKVLSLFNPVGYNPGGTYAVATFDFASDSDTNAINGAKIYAVKDDVFTSSGAESSSLHFSQKYMGTNYESLFISQDGQVGIQGVGSGALTLLDSTGTNGNFGVTLTGPTTNVFALHVDTTVPILAGNLLEVANDGTNMASVSTHGGIAVGPNTEATWGPLGNFEALVSVRVPGVNGDGTTGPEIWLSRHATTTFSSDHTYVDLAPTASSTIATFGSVLGTNNNAVILFSGTSRVAVTYQKGGGQAVDLVGKGSPEGVETANPGSTYRNLSGGAGVSFWVKESGTGNTGWISK